MEAHQPRQDEPLDALAATADAVASRLTAAATRGSDRDGDRLDAAGVLLAAMDRMTAAVIAVLQAAGHHEVIANRGVTPDTWLRAIAGRTGADAGMLLAAAERLADMPAVTAWFQQGVLSWGAVRLIVASTRNLTAAQRAWVDATLADNEADVARLDGDQVAAAVDGLTHRARPDLHHDRDAGVLARRWLSLQPRLDGTADIHGTLDPETAAAALAAFNASGAADGDRDDNDGDGSSAGDGLSDGDRARAATRRANVDILGDLCRQRLARRGRSHQADPQAAYGSTSDTDADGAVTPDDGGCVGDAADGPPPDDADPVDGDAGVAHDAGRSTGGPAGPGRTSTSGAGGGSCRWCGSAPSSARPAFLVVADLAALDPRDPAGWGAARLLWATDRGPVELSAATAQRLACDATLRAVVTDDTRVLGVTAAHPKVSAALRAALVVRDGGCRFPACTQPADACDAHHIVPVVANGPTVLENLALVCRDHHHAIHDSGWQVRLAADGAVTFTRRGVTRVSQPRARQRLGQTSPPPPGRPRRSRARPPDTAPGPASVPGSEHGAGPRQPDREPVPASMPF